MRKETESVSGTEGEGGADEKLWKKAREEVMMRYHPDKFMQKYGTSIEDEEERQRIEKNINLICQIVNQEFDKCARRGEGIKDAR